MPLTTIEIAVKNGAYVAFAGRNYAKDPTGTEAALQSFTAAATKFIINL